MKTKFKNISAGTNFKFANPVEFSIGKTFKRVSARSYCDVLKPEILYKVGTINVVVEPV